MADEELLERIFSQFKFVEPTEEELLADLSMLTGELNGITRSSPAAPESSTLGEAGRVALSEGNCSDERLVDDLAKLSISKSDSNLIIETKGSAKRKELMQLALQAKKLGNLEDAKEFLIRYRQMEQGIDREIVDEKIDQVQKLARQADSDPIRELKLKALALKRAGDLEGALRLMKKASMHGTEAQGKLKYKQLSDRISRQIKMCAEAANYYERAKISQKAKLFTNRRTASEKELQLLVADFKANRPVPEIREWKLSFLTQEIDLDMKEKDMKVIIDTKQVNLKNRLDYKIKVIFECPPNASPKEQERLIALGGGHENVVTFADCINRDIKQQKFFEHRRLKFELIYKERTLLFFTNEVTVASGYVKLTPLTAKCSLQSDVRLTDASQEKRKHSCLINVCIKLRFPITQKEPVKHEESFVYIPTYNVAVDCEYDTATRDDNDYFVSYVVLEKEIARLSEDKSQDAQLKLIDLEGKRDKLQIQVETGQLTMEQYLAAVKDCLVQTKKRCIEYKRCGDMTNAKRLLQYIRLMDTELQEVENPEIE